MCLFLCLLRPLFFAVSAAFAASPKAKKPFEIRGFVWCRRQDLNPRPTVYKTAALPLSYAG
jgi:hypothetical protein